MNGWQQTPNLLGERVRLEPLRHAHAEELASAAADGELWTLGYTSVPEPAHMAAYIAFALEKQEQARHQAFLVRDADGVVVGSTRYYEMNPEVPRLQIGYTWYARRVQRTGLNTEAKALLLEHAFENLCCASVGFETSSRNQASRAAIARLGARQDGILRNHLRHADDSLRDTVAFSIIDSEWPAVKLHIKALREAWR